MKKQIVLLTLFFVCIVSFAQRYDYTNDGLFYKIKDATNHTVAVVSENDINAGLAAYNVMPTDTINIPETVTISGIEYSVVSIDAYAFFVCTDITWVKLPKTITLVNSLAFRSATGIKGFECDDENAVYKSEDGILYNKNMTLIHSFPPAKTGSWECPATVTTIASYAISRAQISSVTFEENSVITTIGANAFYGCLSLLSVVLPETLKTIQSQCFMNCSALQTINIPKSVTSIGTEAFYGCESLIAIDVDTANTIYSSENGVLYNKKKTRLIIYPANKQDANYKVNDSTRIVTKYAFWKVSELSSIELPEVLDSIGLAAFAYCTNLTSIKSYAISAPTKLGNNCFYGIDKNACVLFVPAGSIDSYRDANQWKDFLNIVEIDSTETSILEKSNVSISIYPNPVVSILNVVVGDKYIGETVSLYDINGRCIYRDILDNTRKIIDVNGWTKGIYFLNIGSLCEKVVVK